MGLPEYVEQCPVCNGSGEYEQHYTAGCGGGGYQSTGPCDYCKHPKGHLWNHMRGLGYRMKSGQPVPQSVINQIEIANGKLSA